jgi:hypothetical protein
MTAQDREAFLRSEDACERARLSEPRGVLTVRAEQCHELGDRDPVEEALPFEQGTTGRSADPSRHVGASDVDQLGTGLELGGHGFVQREAAAVDPRVGTHVTSISREVQARDSAHASLNPVPRLPFGSRAVRARVDGNQPGDRLRLAILWLAILNLASLGGPFVPVMYGTAGTLWILTLLSRSRSASRDGRSRAPIRPVASAGPPRPRH